MTTALSAVAVEDVRKICVNVLTAGVVFTLLKKCEPSDSENRKMDVFGVFVWVMVCAILFLSWKYG